MKRHLFLFSTLLACLLTAKVSFTQSNQYGHFEWVKSAGFEIRYIATFDNGDFVVAAIFNDTIKIGDSILISINRIKNNSFIARYNPKGDLIWVRPIKGSSDVLAKAVSVNGKNTHVVGEFQKDANFGSYSRTTSAYYEAFMGVLDENGNWLWTSQGGGGIFNAEENITSDNDNNTYITQTLNGNASFGDGSISTSGNMDVFISKINATGSFVWGTKIGGDSCSVSPIAIETDSNANVYAIGHFYGDAKFGDTLIKYQQSGNFHTVYVTKFDSSGKWLWTRTSTGSLSASVYSTSIDGEGNIFIAGNYVKEVNFGSTNLKVQGNIDGFVAKINKDGKWLWAKSIGGSGVTRTYAITSDGKGNTIVAGNYEDTCWIGADTLLSFGYSDFFVAQLDSVGNWLWTLDGGGNSVDYIHNISSNNNGDIFLNGTHSDSAIFGAHTVMKGTNYIAKLELKPYSLNVKKLLNNTILIYPNPVKNKFNIQLGDAKIFKTEIYDMLGKSIYELVGDKKEHFISEIIESGIYYLSIQTNNGLFTQKIYISK